jgi:hypothetical protein
MCFTNGLGTHRRARRAGIFCDKTAGVWQRDNHVAQRGTTPGVGHNPRSESSQQQAQKENPTVQESAFVVSGRHEATPALVPPPCTTFLQTGNAQAQRKSVCDVSPRNLPQCIVDIFFVAGVGIRVCTSRKRRFAGKAMRQNPSHLPGMWRTVFETSPGAEKVETPALTERTVKGEAA